VAVRARQDAEAGPLGRAGVDEGAYDVEYGDEDGFQPGRLEKPYTRAGGRQEKEAPQKWVQCANCSLWRKARIRPRTATFLRCCAVPPVWRAEG